MNGCLYDQMQQNFKSSTRLIEIALALQLTGAVYVRLHTPISLKRELLQQLDPPIKRCLKISNACNIPLLYHTKLFPLSSYQWLLCHRCSSSYSRSFSSNLRAEDIYDGLKGIKMPSNCTIASLLVFWHLFLDAKYGGMSYITAIYPRPLPFPTYTPKQRLNQGELLTVL